MFDQRLQQPDEPAHNRQDDRADGESFHRPLPHVDRAVLGCKTIARVPCVPFVIRKEEAWIVLDLGMLRQKGRELGVGLEIGRVVQQCRIELQDPRQRWRILPQKILEALPRRVGVQLVRRRRGFRPAGRRCRLPLSCSRRDRAR